MEGEMSRSGLSFRTWSTIVFGLIFSAFPAWAQAPAETAPRAGQAELSLRKSIYTRQYQGQEVQGEERQIGPGDSLWRILVEEKGISGKQFHSYLVVIRGLNPQVKNLDVLRVGDKIFIPLRAEELVQWNTRAEAAAPAAASRDATVDYRVKAGDHLYQILREQLKLSDERKLAQYYALVKDLNPQRKNWDTLLEGEIIRLPTAGGTRVAALRTQSPAGDVKASTDAMATAAPAKTAAETKPATQIAAAAADRRRILKEPAKENMSLLATVIEAIGGQLQQSGEEAVALNEGTIRFDKGLYPVAYHPVLGQKVVIDPDDKIPASLRAKLSDGNFGAQILPLTSAVSVQDAVRQLLARLGYQSLPADRPVIVQEEGVAYEAKGDWIALAPEQSNKTQDILVLNLVDGSSEIPEYLKSQLARRGLQLRDVRLTSQGGSHTNGESIQSPKDFTGQVKNWPRDKKAIADSLLFSFGVAFGVGETISVDLDDGLRVDTQADRIFEQNGKKTAIFFHLVDPVIKKALQEKHGMRVVEIEINSLSSREVINRVLSLLGDPSFYYEHRFPAAKGVAADRLMVAAWGFYLPKRSMFLTDRPIPAGLQRFFFEKGLEIVYFQ